MRSALGIVVGVLLASVAGNTSAQAPAASSKDLQAVVATFQQTCLSAFPDFASLEERMKALGFSVKANDGNWQNGTVLIIPPNRPQAPNSKTCSVTFVGKSKVNALSDAAQAALPEMNLSNASAIRKGVRLDVEFSKQGVDGWIRTNPLGGFTSSIILVQRARTR